MGLRAHKGPHGRSAPGGPGVNGEEEGGALSLGTGLSLSYLSGFLGPPQSSGYRVQDKLTVITIASPPEFKGTVSTF